MGRWDGETVGRLSLFGCCVGRIAELVGGGIRGVVEKVHRVCVDRV